MAVKCVGAQLRTPDGLELHSHHFLPETEPVAEVLLVHGYADHGGRYREFAEALAGQGLSTRAIDLRGHGRSTGKRGHIRHWDEYLTDLEQLIQSADADLPRVLMGHSMGGLLVLDYVGQRAPEKLSAVVVTNPYLELAMAVPRVKLWAGKAAARFTPKLTLPNDIPPDATSTDPEMVQKYIDDPLCFRTATAAWFDQAGAAQERVKRLTRINVPLLYIYSDADPIALPAANEKLAAQLNAPQKTVWMRPGERHEVLNEKNRAQLHLQIGEWLLGQLSAPRGA